MVGLKVVNVMQFFNLLQWTLLGGESYPNVRVLLQFDTQEFLNVLSLVSL